ncbi:MAG: putative integral rane protein, partial [Betaproteobacteria bacterium]|nr:putative integral rane protein [Betaproteobacteria bacterium]
MKRVHVPTIDGRYWMAITLASIFGTNLGDFYAHQSGLGLIG